MPSLRQDIQFVQITVRLGTVPRFEIRADDQTNINPNNAKFRAQGQDLAKIELLKEVLEKTRDAYRVTPAIELCIAGGSIRAAGECAGVRMVGMGSPEVPVAAEKAAVPAADQHGRRTDSRTNVNLASLAELERLPGIGPALARGIIDQRPYENLDELTRVKGIGQAKLDALRARVTV